MRMALLLIFLSASAYGQEQERKLADRLLQPDTTLHFNVSKKSYDTVAATQMRKADTRAFYVSEKKLVKKIAGERKFASTSFLTKTVQPKTASLPAAPTTAGFQQVRSVASNASSDANRKSDVRSYAGARPFLGRGKSQKSLDVKGHPLTIDEVRELLNKNK